MKTVSLAAAAGILLAADAILMMQVVYNRRGEPEAILSLSEREVSMPWRSEENSSLSLVLQTHHPAPVEQPGNRRPDHTGWLNAEKLRELGFDVRSERPSARDVYAVLEAQPDAGATHSRLRVIDAGTDAAKLRAKYGNRTRYAIAPAVVRMHWDRSVSPPAARGWLNLTPNTIYVPPQFLPLFKNLPPTQFPIEQPRYEVKLCYGNLAHPWICGATATAAQDRSPATTALPPAADPAP